MKEEEEDVKVVGYRLSEAEIQRCLRKILKYNKGQKFKFYSKMLEWEHGVPKGSYKPQKALIKRILKSMIDTEEVTLDDASDSKHNDNTSTDFAGKESDASSFKESQISSTFDPYEFDSEPAEKRRKLTRANEGNSVFLELHLLVRLRTHHFLPARDSGIVLTKAELVIFKV